MDIKFGLVATFILASTGLCGCTTTAKVKPLTANEPTSAANRSPAGLSSITCSNPNDSFSFVSDYTKPYAQLQPPIVLTIGARQYPMDFGTQMAPAGSLKFTTYINRNGSYLDVREMVRGQFAIFFDATTGKIKTSVLSCREKTDGHREEP